MTRLFQIAVLSLSFSCLPGCSKPQPDKPIWQQIKIGDLAPLQGPHSATGRPAGVGINIFVLEMPADNIDRLASVWDVMYDRPFKLASPQAFKANAFSVGFGQVNMWNAIARLLDSAGAKKVATATMLLTEGRNNDYEVLRLPRDQTIFYTSADGETEGIRVGPGKLVLRLHAQTIPMLRGLCSVTAQPTFVPPVKTLLPFLAKQARANEFAFASAGFKLRMTPGDFFLLGPTEYTSDHLTLASRLFYKPEGSLFFVPSEENPAVGRLELRPAVRLFLVACSGINA